MTHVNPERLDELAAKIRLTLEGEYYAHEALAALSVVAASVAVDDACHGVMPSEAVDEWVERMRSVMHWYAEIYARPEPGELMN